MKRNTKSEVEGEAALERALAIEDSVTQGQERELNAGAYSNL